MKNEAVGGLDLAGEKLASARDAYARAKTLTARREAAEEIEFWSNKTAFLSVARPTA